MTANQKPALINDSRSEECPCSCQGRPIRANCQAGDTLFEVTGTVTSAQSTFPDRVPRTENRPRAEIGPAQCQPETLKAEIGRSVEP